MICYQNGKENFLKGLSNNKFVVYGIGTVGKEVLRFIGGIDFYCAKKVPENGRIKDIPIVSIPDLEKIKDRLTILVAIKDDKKIFEEVSNEICRLNIEGEIYNYFDKENEFHNLVEEKRKESINSGNIKVNIITPNTSWIIDKFAYKLYEGLIERSVETTISSAYSTEADINHFSIYGLVSSISLGYAPITYMITHIDSEIKVELIKKLSKKNAFGICMSKETMNRLVSYGVNRAKLLYINPAHDGVISSRKIKIGITHQLYDSLDFRKRGSMLCDICTGLNSDAFEFFIMGRGWNAIIQRVREMGFDVDYHEDFDYDCYCNKLPQLDYWIYYGNDEGSMGYLDALSAGIKTLVTPQGFHLDIENSKTIYCTTVYDFIRELKASQREKEEIAESVSHWTWDNFTMKHLEVWNTILESKELEELMVNQHKYNDGIYSMLMRDINK